MGIQICSGAIAVTLGSVGEGAADGSAVADDETVGVDDDTTGTGSGWGDSDDVEIAPAVGKGSAYIDSMTYCSMISLPAPKRQQQASRIDITVKKP